MNTTTIQPEDFRKGSPLPYLCWVIVLGLGFYNLVYVREIAVSLLVVFGVEPKLLLLIDKVGFFFFGVAGFLIILLTEPYFRMGWKKGILGVRFWKIVAIGLASLSVMWAILLGLPGLSDHARPPILNLIFAAVLLVGATLLYRRALLGLHADQSS